MGDITERDWFTVKEAAAIANVSRETLRRYMKQRSGKPPCYKLTVKSRGRWRFPRDKFLAWARGEKDSANV